MAVKFFVAALMVWANSSFRAVADEPLAAQTAPRVTPVNIHLKQALPEDIFSELGKEGKMHFTPNGNLWDSESMQNGVDIDFTNKPFWSAVREACGLWNLTPSVNFNNAPRRLTLQQASSDRAWDSLPACESMGCFIQAENFTRVQTVTYAGQGPNTTNACTIQFKAYIDPALYVTSLNPNIKILDSVDDAGHSMMMDERRDTNYGQQARSLIYDCSASLKYPENAGKKIAHLKGVLNLRASTKVDALTVEKPLEAPETEKTFGDVTITFESLKKENSFYIVKVAIQREDENNNGNGYNDAWSLIQTGQLLDAKGRPFQYNGGGGGGGGNGRYEYTINYSANNPKAGEPAKWIIELPMQPKPVKIPIEFKDLPLP